MNFKNYFFLSLKVPLAIITTLMVSGCAFEFSEDYFVNIEQTEPNVLMAVSPLEDNMTIYEPLIVDYNFTGNNKHQLYSVNIAIDNIGVLGSSDTNDSFEINPDRLTEGEHEVEIRYQFSSGSNSLADLNQFERYEGVLNYTIVIDKSGPKPINLTKVVVEDGTILISWEQTENNIFQEAILNVFLPDFNPPIRTIELNEEIINSLQFNDTISTDLVMEFAITLKNRYGENQSNRVNLTLEKPKMYGEVIDGTSYKLIWEEHPLYNNFEDYSYNVRPNNTFVNLSNRGGEYLVNDSPTFGQQENHSLYLQRNNSNYNLHHVSERIHFGEKFDVPWGIKYVYNSSTNSIFTVVLDGSDTYNAPRDLILFELHPENLDVINSKKLFTINNSNVKFSVELLTNNLIIDLSDFAYVIDPNTMSVIESINSNEYFNQSNFFRTNQNNELLTVTRNLGEVTIFNKQINEIVYQEDIDNNFYISQNALLIFNGFAFYRLVNNGYEAFYSIPTINGSNAHDVLFIPEKKLCIYSNIYDYPVIYNYEQNTLKTVSGISNIYKIEYDLVNEKLTMFERDYEGYQIDMAHLVNLNGEVEKSLECFENNRGLYYYPVNRKLISNQGFFLSNYFN